MSAATTMTWGEMLQTLRKLRGLSQVELAQRAGISHAMLSYYESDKRPITFNMGRKLAEILDVHPTLFMDADVWEDYTETMRQAQEALLQRIQTPAHRPVRAALNQGTRNRPLVDGSAPRKAADALQNDDDNLGEYDRESVAARSVLRRTLERSVTQQGRTLATRRHDLVTVATR